MKSPLFLPKRGHCEVIPARFAAPIILSKS
jgi:hypothetical protein